MSEFKALFRAAASQRGTVPTKEQVKALRAQKQAAAAAAAQAQAQGAATHPVQPQQAPQQPKPPGTIAQPTTARGAAVLPADFFQAGPQAATAQLAPVAPARGPERPTAGTASAPAGPSSGPAAPLPEGFFADHKADAKARGVKLPDAADKEAEFKRFTAAIDEELKTQAAEEAEQAEEEADDKEGREQYRQDIMRQRLELLKQRKEKLAAGAGPSSLPALPQNELSEVAAPQLEAVLGLVAPGGEGPGGGAEPGRLAVPLLGKRRRAIDVLAQDAEGSGGGSGSEVDEEAVLDWRAKKL